MSRVPKIVLPLFAVVVLVTTASAKKTSDVDKEVKSELLKKPFNTKILVGSFIPCPTPQHLNALQMVDTELSPDGSIKYFARAGCYYPGGIIPLIAKSNYVSREGLSGSVPPGTLAWVRGVDFKEDRVEVRVSVNNNDFAEGSGKIKYMVGTGYDTWSADQLMEMIAQGIRIPTYEKLVQIKAEYNTLVGALQKAERKYRSSGGTTDSKLADAMSLSQILEKLQKNRAEFTAMGKSDPQAGAYSEQLSALTPEIAKLSEKVRQERIGHVRDQLGAELAQISEVQSQIRLPRPSSLAEWHQRLDSLAKYSAFLGERQKLLDELRLDGEAPSSQDLKFIADGNAEIATVQNALENCHQQLEIANLNSQYNQLTKKRGQLLDAYSRAFATPKERPALRDLISVLDELVSNRDAAAELGDQTAAAQLTKCRAEAERFKRK